MNYKIPEYIIEEIKNRLDRNFLEEFEFWYSVLSDAFSGEEYNDFEFKYVIKSEQERQTNPEIIESLNKIEKAFKPLANRTSLVAREIHGDFLFTGDVDKTVLDNYLNFSDIEYFIVETPHHGGFYGKAFNNLKTEVLVISRNAKYTPRPEFFCYVDWKILVDTGKQGSCIVEKCSGQPCYTYTITIKSKEAFAYFFKLLLH